MNKATVSDDADECHDASQAMNDNEATVDPRIKAAPMVENSKEHCGCNCKCATPKVKIVMDTCGSHRKNGCNLIVCIDGTSNQFGDQLYNLLFKGTGTRQLTWYNSGIGTYAEPHWRSPRYWLQVLLHKIDLAIAWNFDKTLLAAYQWLADNYEDGGTVSISSVGLIYKGNEAQIPFAYQLYARSEDPGQSEVLNVGTSADVSRTDRFKKAFSRDVKVHFVGAWDTVSSIGVFRGKRVLPLTTEGMDHVCYFRHALALDERRVKFLPEYAWGGSSIDTRKKDNSNEEENLRSRRDKTKDTVPPHTLEVWFPGTHSDIGGGNRQNKTMDRSRPPLRWMVSEAKVAGLRVRDFDRELSSKEQVEIQESLTGLWHLFELLPLMRLTYTACSGGCGVQLMTYRPHFWESRKIHQGQKIHPAVLVEEMKHKYLPRAYPALDQPPPLLKCLKSDMQERTEFWTSIRDDGLKNKTGWLIEDLSSSARVVMKRLINGDDVDSLIAQIVGFENGPKALIGAVIMALEDDAHQGLDQSTTQPSICQLSDDKKFYLLDQALQTILASRGDPVLPMAMAKPFVGGLLTRGTEEHKRVARKFLDFYGDMCILQLKVHKAAVLSVAFIPDCQHAVSGSLDNTIRIWDAATGQGVGERLRGQGDWIRSVAVSYDGQRIISGSDDGSVRIWDRRTGQEVEPSPLRGSAGILSVAISPDGSRIVAGSRDGTIQVWDAETGEQATPLPLEGGLMRSVAIAPDGNRIVSGCEDCTVREWDIRSGAEVMKMTGHTGRVWSVAISQDGTKIVSGSADATVLIWDAKTGQQVGEPLHSRTGEVNSVVFSPDGRRIVSGSDNKSIRIWDIETGKQVGKPLRGHTHWVRSVAISSDGKLIASGSDDMTIRIWDGEVALSADLVDG
ncbi:WD40 repeat-like protein [Coprinopsis marcescibilis]|uniref:WD40 repeat-like protein n=1 Tax=Coprinopsis marcescibilis TaxID=230819 RepID=A0A5C3KK96_COPMA|nr:WD40 repeat-like protein [Coprinopsis marcescibilis]